MDSNRFIVFPVLLLLAEKHSSLEQAEEDVVFSENANMFACYYTKRVRVFLAFINREEETTEAKRAESKRERYDGGDVDIDDLSRWIISFSLSLWRF